MIITVEKHVAQIRGGRAADETWLGFKRCSRGLEEVSESSEEATIPIGTVPHMGHENLVFNHLLKHIS